jgi:hypothetical protein
MGGGAPRHESMAIRNLEQSQLSTAANNVEIAGNGTIQIVWARNRPSENLLRTC